MSSSALADLSARLDEVKILSASDPSRVKGLLRPDLDLSSAVSRGCLVLLCAHLEGYLEDVMVAALDALVSNRPKVESLPVLLRAAHVEEHLAQIEPIRDRKSRAPRIERMFSKESGLWATGADLDARMIRHASICAQMDNPSSTQVRHFLELLDIDIEDHLDSIGKGALLKQVNGLVARRNAIAHGEISSTATSRDVDHYVALVVDLAFEVDRRLARAVQDICGAPTLPW